MITSGHLTISEAQPRPTLVTGGTGKTGRRVMERLAARGVPIRIGSRSASPPFDWSDSGDVGRRLHGAESVYVSYYPDSLPGAMAAVRSFLDLAVLAGVGGSCSVSGRGEEEAQRAERVVQEAGVEWTIVRCAWFSQNFSENYLLEPVISGEVVLPAGDVPEPFVDADDIADVAVAAFDRGQSRRRALRVDRPASTHLRAGNRGDRRGDRPRDPVPAGIGGRVRVRAHQGGRTGRVRVPPDLPVQRGPWMVATPT